MANDVFMKGDPVPFARAMTKLINNKEFGDIKFIVGEGRKHIYAHRCILASRCEVFRAMFTDKTQQENSKDVPFVLSEVEPDIFMIMLEFIYTNCISVSRKTVVDVLASSIEYGLEELRKLCNAFLVRNLSVATACETMQAAYTYGQDELRATTLAYIEENTKEVLKSRSFKELTEQPLAFILMSSRLLLDEAEILASVKEWASVNSAVLSMSVAKVISLVIKHVRLPLLSDDELQKVEKDNAAQQIIPVVMIAFAWKFHALHQAEDGRAHTRLRRGTAPRECHHGLIPWDQ